MTNKFNLEFINKYKTQFFLFLLLIIGIIVRVASFSFIPCGLNQDEAFAGYEAYSIANYGIDSSGYHNPCYFVSWGSGMNVLESYLAIPFIKIFGLSAFTFRLPQLICSCISLIVFYLLLKEVFNNKIALLGLFILSISPWHIMLSRWGLESNLAPSFLLFGLYFFIKGTKNNKLWLISATMYGLALYAYSITWVVVPLTIFFMGLYIIISKISFSLKYIIFSTLILFIFALPLILFMLVNAEYIPEISTSFISIPKLVVMRESDISLKNIISPNIWKNFFNLYLGQNDGLIWNSIEKYGMFYKISLPFICLGFIRLIVDTLTQLRKKAFSEYFLILIATIFTFISCLTLTNININRINSIHIFTVILISLGLYTLYEFGTSSFNKLKQKNLNYIALTAFICSIIIFSISFNSFSHYYFNEYNNEIAPSFKEGVGDAVKFVNDNDFQKVGVDPGIYFPQILFYDKTPTTQYIESVRFSNYPSAYLNASCFTKYTFGIDAASINDYDAYIIREGNAEYFEYYGFKIIHFGKYNQTAVAVK